MTEFAKVQALFPGLEADAIVAKVQALTPLVAKVTDLETQLNQRSETLTAVKAQLDSITAVKAELEQKLSAFQVAEVRAEILKTAGVTVADAMFAKLDSRVSAFLRETDEARKAEIKEDAVLFAKANGVRSGSSGQFTPEARKVQPKTDSPFAGFHETVARLQSANPTWSLDQVVDAAKKQSAKGV